MFRVDTSFLTSRRYIFAGALLLCVNIAAAQRPGGARITFGASGTSRPDGVDETDSLKTFHQTMAMQATGQQISEFQELVKTTNAAQEKLSTLNQASRKLTHDDAVSLNQALQSARSGAQKFQSGFSEAQRSGLKEILRKLDKADADLELEEKKLEEFAKADLPVTEIPNPALANALADFSEQQIAVGREMGILLSNGQDTTFNLPSVKKPINVGARTVVLGVSGVLSQTKTDGDLRSFQLDQTVDFSDVQQNISQILADGLASMQSCNQRLTLKHATIFGASPGSSVVLQLHFERWSCSRFSGSSAPTELAEGDGTAELLLTPTVQNSVVSLRAEFKRIDANGMLGSELRSGDLGDDLRDSVAKTLLSLVQGATDFKTTLPPALQGNASLQAASFQESNATGLKESLQAQVQISNAQVTQLADQLNHILSAKGAPTP